MALEPHRYKGIARNGKIELEPGAKLPEGAEVIVLFSDAPVESKIRTLGDLLNSGFVGMYADREDLPKTPEEFREWRRKAWERSHE